MLAAKDIQLDTVTLLESLHFEWCLAGMRGSRGVDRYNVNGQMVLRTHGPDGGFYLAGAPPARPLMHLGINVTAEPFVMLGPSSIFPLDTDEGAPFEPAYDTEP